MTQCCGNETRLVYACSGGADVGEISDRVARLLVRKGYAKSSCLAGVGGHVAGFVASALGDAENIVIDGCPLSCARKTLEHAGASVTHYVLTDMGLKKGQTPADESIVNRIAGTIMAESPKGAGGSADPGGCGCSCGTC